MFDRKTPQDQPTPPFPSGNTTPGAQPGSQPGEAGLGKAWQAKNTPPPLSPGGRTAAAPNTRKPVHPAYEFGPDGVVMRFTEDQLADDGVTERKVRLIATAEGVKVEETDERAVKLDENTRVIDARYDYPPPLSREWPREDLDGFRRGRTAPAPSKLAAEMTEAVQRHLDLDDQGAAVILVGWVVLSFVYPALPAVPFLLLIGGKGSGKTQALDLVQKLCRCGHKSRGTAAALGDLIASQRAVWLIDQANKLFGDLLQDLIDSYKAGATRTVTNPDVRGKTHCFPTYGPKAFAAHKEFDDDLRDRCIQIAMSPSEREVEPILAEDNRLDQLRWQLYRFAAKRYREFFDTRAYREREALGAELGFGGRAWELWWPMELVFDWLDVPEIDRTAARLFYRSQLPNVKAELDPLRAELLRVLMGIDDGESDSFDAYSSELGRWVNSGLDPSEQVRPAKIGIALRDLSLLLDSDRGTWKGEKVTRWKINAVKLRSLAARYRVGGS